MRRVIGFFALVVGVTACSKTTPDSQYPPPVGPLPVKPMPTDNPFTDEPAAGSSESAGQSSSSAAPAAAISGELPAAPPTALARSHVCKDKQCKFSDFLPDPKLAKSEPGGQDSPGTLWIEDVAKGSSVLIPRDHQLELVGVVLTGDAVVGGDEGGRVFKLGQWSAFDARGCGVAITGGPAGAKLVLGLAAVKGNLTELIAEAKAKPFAVRWAKRPRALTVVPLEKTSDLAWGDGAFHVRIAFGSETPLPASFETLMTSANAPIKEHDHPGWEHIAVLQGSGTMRVGGTDHAVSAGSIFDLAPSTKHSFTPSGKEPLLAVQMYTPSGPEQRFAKLATAAAKDAKGGAAAAPAKPPPAPAKPPPAAKPAPKAAAKPPPAPPKPPAVPAAPKK
jgi:mannose-6-phosphate isomerase-like protein (cupin superfamily)